VSFKGAKFEFGPNPPKECSKYNEKPQDKEVDFSDIRLHVKHSKLGEQFIFFKYNKAKFKFPSGIVVTVDD